MKWFYFFCFIFRYAASGCNLAMMKALKPHGATPSPINQLPSSNTKERFGIMRPVARKASTATLCLDLLSEKERVGRTHYCEEDADFDHAPVLLSLHALDHFAALTALANVHSTEVNRFDHRWVKLHKPYLFFHCRGFKDKKSAWVRVVSSRAVGSQMRVCSRNEDKYGFKYADWHSLYIVLSDSRLQHRSSRLSRLSRLMNKVDLQIINNKGWAVIVHSFLVLDLSTPRAIPMRFRRGTHTE